MVIVIEEWMRPYILDRPSPTSYEELEQALAQVPRTGWFARGIPRERCETTLEHSNGLGLEATLFTKHIYNPAALRNGGEPLDPKVLCRKARRHDCNDGFAVDIPPHYGFSTEQKYALEWTAVQLATANLGELGDDIIEDWLDIELGNSAAAKVLKQLDKIQTVPHALRYKREFPESWSRRPLGLDQFYPYARSKLTCPTLIAIADKLSEEEYRTDPVQQYHLLLSLGADFDRFDHLMKKADAAPRGPCAQQRSPVVDGEQARVAHVE